MLEGVDPWEEAILACHVSQALVAALLLFFFWTSDIDGGRGGSAAFVGSFFLAFEILDDECVELCMCQGKERSYERRREKEGQT